jgi:hypothetical protein
MAARKGAPSLVIARLKSVNRPPAGITRPLKKIVF